ncbi:MAG: polysaccharide deacetylase family protein [Acidaminococcaceae bacterium]|nr:polysaccharide deacetylase family protein [Acidaminococcaceae bacterium]MDD4722147.1 polysaccharide deacetylase family protein [Acidaminococcaceae bacterium]
MKGKYKIIVGTLLLVFVCIMGLGIQHFWQQKTGANYKNITDFTKEYDATAEIAVAQKALTANSSAAKIISKESNGKKIIALTIDGMGDKGTIEGLLDVLKKYNMKATFFLEGENATLDPELVAEIKNSANKIGSYSFVGLEKAQNLPAEYVLADLCKARKALKITTGTAPDIVKINNTQYTKKLLQVIKATGSDYAVSNGIVIPQDKITGVAEADSFVKTLAPGSIVTLQLGVAVDIKPEKSKVDDRPAVDKQPGLLYISTTPKNSSAVEVLERICIALQLQNIETEFVSEFPKLIVTSSIEQRMHERIYACLTSLGKIFLPSVAYASEREATDELKMITTTARAVPFIFTGLQNDVSTYKVLDALDSINGHGTFFVTERELKTKGSVIRAIKNRGNELAVALRSLPNRGYADSVKEIRSIRNILRESYGIETTLVKQSSGVVSLETKRAVADQGCRLVGYRVNVVQTRHKNAKSVEQVLPEIFGQGVISLGRGWIVHIRMDYYTDSSLAAKMLLAIKRTKIDNIAYSAYDDMSERNPSNDSAYAVTTVGDILNDTEHLYQVPVPEQEVPERLRPNKGINYLKQDGGLLSSMKKRYIGFKWVNADDRILGFSEPSIRRFDMAGLIHTTRPVVFFTFDDWGTDAAINPLLYVLRKHKVQGTFFILTHNVAANPNLLRAIAEDGNDIGCHSYLHKPMAVRDKTTHKQKALQTKAEYIIDATTAYKIVESITGNVTYQGKPVLTRFFRPPTLAISKMGVEVILSHGYQFIVAGSGSTEDYNATSTEQMIDRIRDSVYENGKVRKGAIVVMHMSDFAKYTAHALDAVLTANERRADNDPAKFIPAKLSDYLVEGYNQANAKKSLALELKRDNDTI